jgi:hypothetical protein
MHSAFLASYTPSAPPEEFGRRGEKLNKDMEETDGEAGLPDHRGVDSVVGEEIAEQRVFAVRGSAADLVTRVEVAQENRDTKNGPMSSSFRITESFALIATAASKFRPAPSFLSICSSDNRTMNRVSAAFDSNSISPPCCLLRCPGLS